MKKLFLHSSLIIYLFISGVCSAQDSALKIALPGSWFGKLNTGALELRVIFNITTKGNDSLIATLDSPDQGVKGIKIGPVLLKGDSIIISAPLLRASLNGEIKSDTTIDGRWTQSGMTL
ncbi:MAG TPA: hypothetical protein VJ963_03540, partial [Bacteroidales bacterium]|nr:hypothetical protein [Bacteroidales bacterium]